MSEAADLAAEFTRRWGAPTLLLGQGESEALPAWHSRDVPFRILVRSGLSTQVTVSRSTPLEELVGLREGRLAIAEQAPLIGSSTKTFYEVFPYARRFGPRGHDEEILEVQLPPGESSLDPILLVVTLRDRIAKSYSTMYRGPVDFDAFRGLAELWGAPQKISAPPTQGDLQEVGISEGAASLYLYRGAEESGHLTLRRDSFRLDVVPADETPQEFLRGGLKD